MGHIEELAQRRREQEEANQPEKAKPVEGMTVSEILHDDELSRLFLKWLEGVDREDLAKKLGNPAESLSEKDHEELANIRKDFLSLLHEAEELSGTIDGEMVDQAIAHSPKLKKIQETSGKEGIHNSLLRGIREGAFNNPDYLAELKKKVADREKTKASIGVANKKLESLLAKYGISKETYFKSFEAGDLAEVYEAIDRHGGFFERHLFGKERKADDKFGATLDRHEIERLLASLKKDMEAIGVAMHSMLMGDETAAKVLSGHVRSEKVATPKEEGFSFAEMGRLNKEFTSEKSQEEINKEWQEYQKRYPTAVSRDALARRFASEHLDKKMGKKKVGKRGWGSVLCAILLGSIENALK